MVLISFCGQPLALIEANLIDRYAEIGQVSSVKDLDFLGFFTALDYNGCPQHQCVSWRLGGFRTLEVAQVSIVKRATLLLTSGIIDCASGNSENSFQQSF